jgi:xylulose-5-phosphate/fructose-6-phosphate phosphoketolase
MNAPSGPAEGYGMDPSLSAYGPARATVAGQPLSVDELHKIHAYWRASLYLCVGMRYLQTNPLLRRSEPGSTG